MIVERVYTDGLAQVAWLIGDAEAAVAAVIDPRRDVQIYKDLADEHGLRIIAALETHVHADFVSGVLELQSLSGAEIHAARLGESAFSHHALDDQDEVQVGSLRLQALHTPGHTPEHLSFLLYERPEAKEPVAIFTGDALFVGEVGRPDLLGDDETEGLVKQLYETIFERFSKLPDDLTVYPGHGAGSSCGRSIGSAPSTTIGQERVGNYAFTPRSLIEFRKAVMKDMPPAPTYYPVLKRVNKQGAAPLSSLQVGSGRDPEVIESALKSGAAVIDSRTPNEYARRHIPNTISIGAGGSFVTWAGWLAPYDRPVYLVVDDDAQFSNLVTDLHRIGIDNVAGFLEGGVDAWVESGRDVGSYDVVNVEELHDRMESSPDLQVIDVRGIDEWKMGHIPGAQHTYLGSLVASENGLPENKTLAFICGSGYRSNVAASVARARGFRDVINVDGGVDAWASAGFPVSRGD